MNQTWVAGVDGCRGGWLVVLRRGAELRHRLLGRFEEVFALEEKPRLLTVDMPIGLLDGATKGGRTCDQLARKLLSERGCCVFSPPVRSALRCATYDEAFVANRGSSAACIGISKQAFALAAKLREVDAAMTPALQRRVREVHPEVSFYELNQKKPLAERKKGLTGFVARQALLNSVGFGSLVADALTSYQRRDVARDDINDACIACWTAGRILCGNAVRIPKLPPVDSRQLRMEIWR